MKAIIAGIVGGAAGALIWGMIAYLAHTEVGYVAWGIGGLVGFCVRSFAADLDNGLAGIIAAVLSIVSILAGKLLAAVFVVNWLVSQGNIPGGLPWDAYYEVVGIAFKASFGVVDIVFFVLAIMTAYRLGSSSEGD